jgi:type I restriction enzyme R subunit
MDLNEDQTRSKLIDKRLKKSGWINCSFNFEEEYNIISKNQGREYFLDYLLFDDNGKPLAIIEAKRTSRDPLIGRQQAINYAEAIEENFGIYPFIYLTNGEEIWFFNKTSNPYKVKGFSSLEDLKRKLFLFENNQNVENLEINKKIAGRDYQQEGIKLSIKRYQDNYRKSLLVMATGTGKTRVACSIVDSMIKLKKIRKVLFVSDRTNLRDQAMEVFKEHLPQISIGKISDKDYDDTKEIYFASLQSLQNFYEDIPFGNFDLIIADECHRSIYNKWKLIIEHFDSLVLGLTATPSFSVKRDTFNFFEHDNKKPVFEYSYEEAIKQGYLVPFEAYKSQTQFQIAGINRDTLSEQDINELKVNGIDPDEIDFKGKDLEKKVTNQDTNLKLIKEFFDNSIKSKDSTLPGKSIIFAINRRHAGELYKLFLQQYPQYPGMVEQIHYKVERKDDVLKKFKNEDFPRIAISVDMLDTGIDVPAIQNLGFFKPVMSYIKFWQMIGRGTRTIQKDNEKPWCKEGEKNTFLIIDSGGNFERFEMDPNPKDTSSTLPIAIRYFRNLIKLVRKIHNKEDFVYKFCFKEIRSLISLLPEDSPSVMEYYSSLEKIKDNIFWETIDKEKLEYLNFNIAPIINLIKENKLHQWLFRNLIIEYLLSQYSNNLDDMKNKSKIIKDEIILLPSDHPIISDHLKETISKTINTDFENSIDKKIFDNLIELSKIMHLKRHEERAFIRLNLEDYYQDQGWIIVGPKNEKNFD